MRIGSIVGRISYNKDIIFRIRRINGDVAILEGLYTRLIANSLLSDLEEIEEEELNRLEGVEKDYFEQVVLSNKANMKHITGKILHIDSDPKYLKKCMRLYKDMGIYAHGACMDEKDFAKNVLDLIYEINPDIVILTGHDSYNKRGLNTLSNYTNTEYFIKAIKIIRKFYSRDHIFIFAGACQSNFEALVASGANFASSPQRINIDVFEPAIVGIKSATTSLTEIISINEIFIHSDTKGAGISGVESYGKMRLLQ